MVAGCPAGSDGEDTIVLAAGATYTLAPTTPPGPPEDLAASGDLDITESLILQVAGGTATIDGNGTATGERVLDIAPGGQPGVNVSIIGLTIQNGRDVGIGGGGIRAQGTGTLTISGSAISGNQEGQAGSASSPPSGNGGGINYASSGLLTITGSAISGNSTGQYGGGIYYDASGTGLTLTDSTVSRNSGQVAGVFYQQNNPTGALTVSGSTFSANTAATPVAILSVGALLVTGTGTDSIATSTFSGNSVSGPLGFSGTAAGLAVVGAALTVSNSTFSGNTSSGGGNNAAILVQSPSLTLNNDTIADNDGGLSNMMGSVTIKGTILANNGANCVPPAAIVDGGYNLSSDGTCTPAIPNPTSQANVDPQLQPLGNYGGPTQTRALRPTSPAIDKIPAGPVCPATDQRGVAFPRPQPRTNQNTPCDIGAFELRTAPTVTGLAPDSGPVAGGTLITIGGAKISPGSTVTVGGNPCTGPDVALDGTQVTCTTPPGIAGPQPVVLTTAEGEAIPAGTFTYLTLQQAAPSPVSLSFGPQKVNTTSAAQNVTLTNSGGTPLALGGAAITGANPSDFAIVANTCGATLAGGASCIVAVNFTPTAAGARGAALTFTTDSGGIAGSQVNVTLSGTGTAPTVAFAPTFLAFAIQQVGTTSAERTVTLTNNGTAPLLVGGVAITSTNAGDFVLSSNGCVTTVAVGGSCTVGVQFRPAANDVRVAFLTFTDDADGVPGGQQNIPLSGSGVGEPSASPSPAASPSPTPSPSPGFTVTVSTGGPGSGTVSPGTGTYSGTIAFTATPAANNVLLGWYVDGAFVGFGNPLNLPVTQNRTVRADFAPRPAFTDVPSSHPDYEAITQLAARGVIRGTSPGIFEPGSPVVRAQTAALIGRLFGYQPGPVSQNPFPDRCDPATPANCIDDELWGYVATLAANGIARGYTDPATCQAAGTTAPCYLPRDPVLGVQVVAFITRAMVDRGYWTLVQDDDPSVYSNVPAATGHRLELVTFVRNAGAVPGQPLGGPFTGYSQAATRAFAAETLWQAYSAYFSTNRIP